jgi:hypothetical protein
MVKTTFIMGAGVCIPFKFPSGIQLVNNIIDQRNQSEAGDAASEVLNEIFTDCGLTPGSDKFKQFYIDLKNSNLNSIDRFLNDFGNSKKEDFELYQLHGRAAITVEIVKAEIEYSSNMFNSQQEYIEKNVFRHIWNELPGNDRPSEIQELKFVTFNYDRMFEHFIYRSLVGLGYSHDLAIKTIAQMDIVHVYGKIGDYNPEDFSSSAPLFGKYHTKLSFEQIFKKHKQRILDSIPALKLLTDDRIDPEVQEKLTERFANNRRVVILGFGYDHLNCSRLRECFEAAHPLPPNAIDNHVNAKNWYGSAYQKYESECVSIRGRLHMHENNLGMLSHNDVHFMRDRITLFT